MLQGGKPFDQFPPCFPGQDDLIDKSASGSPVGVGKLGGVFRFFLSQFFFRVIGLADFFSENDLTGPFGPHDGYFRPGPGKIEIGPDML